MERREKKIQVSIALYPSTLKLLDFEARRQDRSRSGLIEHILREYFKEKLM